MLTAAFIACALAPAVAYLLREWRRRASPSPLSRESLTCAFVSSVIVLSFVSLILLELSAFRFFTLLWTLTAVDVILLVAACFARRANITKENVRKTHSRVGLLLLAVLAAALLLRIPPSLYVHGGQDQGVYLAMSQHFVRTGQVFIHDPILQQAYSSNTSEALALRQLFLNQQDETAFDKPFYGRAQLHTERRDKSSVKLTHWVAHRFEGMRVPGFYIADKESGLVVPQFFHLHPLWLALFSLAFGLKYSVYMLTCFSILGLAVIFFLARRAFGSDWAALLGVAFLTVNILQVWTNRFPVSETLTQLLLFAGLLFYYRWRARDDWLDMWLSAAAFGLFTFAHAIGFFYLPIFVLAFWFSRSDNRTYIYFNLIFLLNIYVLAHATHFNYPYLFYQLHFRANYDYYLYWPQVLQAGIVFLAAVNLVKVIFGRWLFAALWILLRRGRLVLFGLITLALVPAALLPITVSKLESLTAHVDPNILPTPFAQFIQFTWYATVPGVLLAVIGAYLYLKRQFPKKPALFPLMALAAMAVALVSCPPDKYQFYYGRYFVSGLLPFAMLFCALGIVRLWQSKYVYNRAFAALGLAAVFLSFVVPYLFRPTYRLQEQNGAFQTLNALEAQLPRDALIFLGNYADIRSDYFNARYAAPLFFIGGHYVLPYSDSAAMMQAGRVLAEAGNELIWVVLARPHAETVIAGEVEIEPLACGVERIDYSEKVIAIPKYIQRIGADWCVYKMHFREENDLPITIHGNSKFYRTSGFYPQEDATGCAWTRGSASIESVDIAARGRPLEVTLYTAGKLPPALSLNVKVLANEETIFDKTVTGEGLQETRKIGPLLIPARLNRGEISLGINSDTWVPSKVDLANPDNRLLGLDIAGIVIRPLTAAEILAFSPEMPSEEPAAQPEADNESPAIDPPPAER